MIKDHLMDYEHNLARQMLGQQKKLIKNMNPYDPTFQNELSKLLEIIIVLKGKEIDIGMRTGRNVLAERIAAEIEQIFIHDYF